MTPMADLVCLCARRMVSIGPLAIHSGAQRSTNMVPGRGGVLRVCGHAMCIHTWKDCADIMDLDTAGKCRRWTRRGTGGRRSNTRGTPTMTHKRLDCILFAGLVYEADAPLNYMHVVGANFVLAEDTACTCEISSRDGQTCCGC